MELTGGESEERKRKIKRIMKRIIRRVKRWIKKRMKRWMMKKWMMKTWMMKRWMIKRMMKKSKKRSMRSTYHQADHESIQRRGSDDNLKLTLIADPLGDNVNIVLVSGEQV